jgi:hypothetical protein
MANRRTDETPLAPRRPLSGPLKQEEDGDAGKRPVAEKVTSALSQAGSAVAAAVSTSPSSTKGGTSISPSAPAKPSGKTSGKPSKSSSSAARPRGTRRARLRLVHLDPWSVMKTAFLLSIAFGIVTVVSVAVVWSVLGAAGVWDSINKTVADVMGGTSGQTFDVQNYVGTSRVLGFTMIVAVVDVILVTAIATLGAFLYNLAAALLGGIEVTLAEDDR